MRAEIRAKIAIHANRFPSREVCGFLIEVNGEMGAYPTQNVATHPSDTFVIAPEAWIQAETMGEVVGIYHSHPDGPPAPSSDDRAACLRSGLSWYLFHVPTQELLEIRDLGIPPLKGRNFIWGRFDCWTLVYDYYLLELGIQLPSFKPYEENFWKNGHNYLQERYEGMRFTEVKTTQKHDVVIMRINSQIPIHNAIITGGGKILHHLPLRLSCEDVYSHAYQRMTTHILRYKDFL